MGRHVFISHSGKNRPVANAICHALEHKGIRCWIAPRDVVPGQWPESILKGIQDATVMLLLFSSDAAGSDDVFREVHLAARYKVLLIPVRVEDVEPKGRWEYALSTYHWLDIFPPPCEAYFEDLVRKVCAVAGDAVGGGAQRGGPGEGVSPRALTNLELLDLVQVPTGWWALVAQRDPREHLADPEGLEFHPCQVSLLENNQGVFRMFDPFERVFLPPSRHAALDVRNGRIRIFLNFKARSGTFAMSGALHHAPMANPEALERRVLFENRNWGFFARFDGDDVIHYSYANRHWIRNVTQEASCSPEDAFRARRTHVMGHSGGILDLPRHGASLDEQRISDAKAWRTLCGG